MTEQGDPHLHDAVSTYVILPHIMSKWGNLHYLSIFELIPLTQISGKAFWF